MALLDHDDLLAETALFWVAHAINAIPDAGLIYSDEDKVTQSGRRYAPYFKSDWNPDLFLCHNMICHLGVYRTDLLRKLKFREGYEGAQDWDLALRCTEQLTPQQIVHIPRVLYHWRSHPGSTAQTISAKYYALEAAQRALNDHFSRINVLAKVELLDDLNIFRARYAIPSSAPMVSLIIPTRNGLSLIKRCIESILAKTTYKNYEILIVDNNSDDPDALAYFASIADGDRIRVLRDERHFNYSALNNTAAKQARGEYLGLVNNDI